MRLKGLIKVKRSTDGKIIFLRTDKIESIYMGNGNVCVAITGGKNDVYQLKGSIEEVLQSIDWAERFD